MCTQYDWDTIASETDYLNGDSAHSQWKKIKAKLKVTSDTTIESSTQLTPKTPKQGKKRGSEGDNITVTSTPKKKAKQSPDEKANSSEPVAAAEEDTDDADDAVKREQDD